MPELPEVETVKCGLDTRLKDRTIEDIILYRPNLRYPFPDHLDDITRTHPIDAVRRRAKYLLFDIGDYTLIGHLGMSGTYRVQRQEEQPPRKHDHMVWLLDNGDEVVYHDPRRFGFLLMTARDTWDQHSMIRTLGVEPLSDALTPEFLSQRFAGKTTTIKQALLDQRIIAGIGNIYASEALFRTGIHPETQAQHCLHTIPALIASIQAVLHEAIASGGSTLRDYGGISGESGYFQHRFQVYGRTGQPCDTCTTPIQQIRQSGRSTFFCPRCQPSAME